jgi:hypothetical protein
VSGDRKVVGVDALGQWEGSLENEPGWDSVRYFFLPVDAGQSDDVFNPVQRPMEPVPHHHR